MKSIHYAGDVLMTSDAIADAIVKYAETLARNDTSASIEVPVLTEEGTLTEASFLLGPASQIVAVSVDSDLREPIDDDLLERIQVARSKFDRVTVSPSDSPPESILDFDY